MLGIRFAFAQTLGRNVARAPQYTVMDLILCGSKGMIGYTEPFVGFSLVFSLQNRLIDVPVERLSVFVHKAESRWARGVGQGSTVINLPATAWAGALSRLPRGRQARTDLSRDKSAKKKFRYGAALLFPASRQKKAGHTARPGPTGRVLCHNPDTARGTVCSFVCRVGKLLPIISAILRRQ